MGEQVIDRRISFNGGELSPWTDPRLDLEKYRSGCRTLRNFKPNVYGGAFRRQGTLYMGAEVVAGKKMRLQKFEFSVTTTLILEFGHLYLRFWTTGDDAARVMLDAAIYQIVSPWSESELFELQFAQQNDTVYVTHPNHRPRVLRRQANNNWSLSPLSDEWPALLEENITLITLEVTGGSAPVTYPAWVAKTLLNPYAVGTRVSYGGKQYRCIHSDTSLSFLTKPPGTFSNWTTYWSKLEMAETFGIGQTVTMEASEDLFQSGHVGSTWLLKYRREEPYVSIPLTGSAGDLSDPLFVLGDWSANVVVNSGGSWEVKAVIERSFDLVTWEVIRSITSSGVVSDIKSGTELDPCYLRLKITSADGSRPTSATFVLEASDSYHYGLLYVTAYVSAQELTTRVVFPPVAGETVHWQEPAWSDYRGFPAAVVFHENRLLFGGSRARPQTCWASIIDDYENFRVSADDDGGLAFTLASDAANGIQWLCSQDSLIIGTTGSEWVIGTRDTQSALTPSSIAAKRSTTYGSAPIQAQVVSEAVIFIQRSARKVREFVYTFEEDGYTAPDLTLLSEHIPDRGIVEIAVQKNPETILWAITTDGQLVGVVYERGQNVAGWFRLDTGDGDLFESITSVSSNGEEDEIWVTVNREVEGVRIRYIERFQPDIIRKLKDNDQANLCYVDSAIIVTGDAMTMVSGLDHLEGREVSVLSNGAPEGNKTVVDGSITLSFPAETAIVGLPYESTLEPTFLETNDPSSVSKYGMKKVANVIMEVWQTLGGTLSASPGIPTRIEFREPSDYMDQAVPLFTGVFETISLESSSSRQASLIFTQDQPLPANILSLHIKYDLNAT